MDNRLFVDAILWMAGNAALDRSLLVGAIPPMFADDEIDAAFHMLEYVEHTREAVRTSNAAGIDVALDHATELALGILGAAGPHVGRSLQARLELIAAAAFRRLLAAITPDQRTALRAMATGAQQVWLANGVHNQAALILREAYAAGAGAGTNHHHALIDRPFSYLVSSGRLNPTAILDVAGESMTVADFFALTPRDLIGRLDIPEVYADRFGQELLRIGVNLDGTVGAIEPDVGIADPLNAETLLCDFRRDPRPATRGRA